MTQFLGLQKWPDANLVKIGFQPDNKIQKLLSINWMLHNRCNNSCSYCPEWNWSGSDSWLKISKVENFLNNLFSHYDSIGIDAYVINFTGGEPTVWKGFQQMCLALKKLDNVFLTMTTNGRTVNKRFWNDVSKAFYRIYVSYHSESANHNQLIDNLKCMSSHTNVTLRIMMHYQKKYWNKCVDFINAIREECDKGTININYILTPLQKNYGTDNRELFEYNEEMLQYIKDNMEYKSINFFGMSTYSELHPIMYFANGEFDFVSPSKLISNNLNKFKNWKCNAGVESLFIDSAGEISKATCRQDGPIGNILNNKISFSTEPVICSFEKCFCGTDIMISKEK